MPASIPTVDRRSIPTVAIIGNDAVLVAAPATPVQLSHACLRRGFSVAVPASWGDELIAAETMRKLALRDKGPAVMCVCPFARSRLLTPGPDLEPFLVSLVPPPVATARYLRTVYGERGVHITYIGSCPSANDPVIDACLTPDAFLADLAERGIALSEQPLVFDSIVPPDRRRWCSLPGGVPSAEMSGSDTDPRTLIEIDRDDVSTDLAQHIIAREHVLLDLAPSLGCACSGAIGAPTSRGARAAVAAVEPPRALGPVIDLTVVVALDAPFSLASVIVPAVDSPALGASRNALERRLDEMLGAEASHPQIEPALEAELAAELDADLAEVLAATRAAATPPRSESVRAEPALVSDPREPTAPSSVAESGEPAVAIEAAAVSATDRVDRVAADAPPTYHVRRRTPPAMPSRYAGNSVPKATGADGRPLPRAYVAKRRTPPMGIPSIADDGAPAAETDPVAAEAPTSVSTGLTVASGEVGTSASVAADSSAAVTSELPSADQGERSAPGHAPRPEPPAEPQVSSGQGGGAATAAMPNQGAFRMLMFAVLLAFAVVVLYTLRS